MGSKQCCCEPDEKDPGPDPESPIPGTCEDISWCSLMTEDLELEIRDWHMIGVRLFGGSINRCVVVEIKWDLVATLYRASTYADLPIRMWTSFRSFEADPCNGVNSEVRRLHQWTTLGQCLYCCTGPDDGGTQRVCERCGTLDDPPPDYPCFPHGADGNPTGYNGCQPVGSASFPQGSGGSKAVRYPNGWTSYYGFPAQTINWFEAIPSGGLCDELETISQAMSATSSPKIVGTATRKVYNLTTNELIEEQSMGIEADVWVRYNCSYQKNTCYTGTFMRARIEIKGAVAFQFPPLAEFSPTGLVNSTFYYYFFDPNHTFGEQPNRLDLIAPFTSGAIPLNIDFIERPAPFKAFCCQNFSTTDCNGGTPVCTNDPSEDFQRCLSPYGTSTNWQCYRKPTSTLGVA